VESGNFQHSLLERVNRRVEQFVWSRHVGALRICK
jgi:hypothetical protein